MKKHNKPTFTRLLLMTLAVCLSSVMSIDQLHAQFGPTGTPQNGLVSYYPFDGASNAAVSRELVTSANANLAVISPTDVSFNTSGIRGNCLQVNGANATGINATFNNAIIPAAFPGRATTTVNGTNEYTVSFWFRPNPNQAGSTMSLLSKRTQCTNTNNQIFWDLRINTTDPDDIRYGHEVFLNGNTVNNNAAGTAARALCWNHVVITRTVDMTDGTATSLMYVNGVLLNPLAAAVAVQSIADPANLAISASGCINNFSDGTNDFNGRFDELMVYNRPLSALEVIDLHGAFTTVEEGCCSARNNPDYLQIRADDMSDDEVALLQTYGIRRWQNFPDAGSNIWVIGDGATHILPNKIYLGDDAILEIRSGSTADFTNTDVVLGNCANIAVNAGNVIAHNAIFRPCDEFGSWRGIQISNNPSSSATAIAYPDTNASLTFNECTFVNAEEAFYTTTRVTTATIELNLTNNLFTNCHRALVVNRIPTTGSLNFTGSITGNTIQIDDQVNQINYCLGIAEDYMGILAVNSHLRRLLISQNKFIDATQTISNVHFEGINLTTTRLADIANNQFTNNDRAIVLIETSELSVENNTFEVTRRSTADEDNYQLTYEGPDGGSQDQKVLIRGNKFVNSAAVENATIDLPNGQLGSGAIYATGYARWVTIEGNEIDGFEIGVFANVSNTVAQIRNNSIKAHVFGILQRGAVFKSETNTMHIACNEIDMYWSAANAGVPIEGIHIMGISTTSASASANLLSANVIVEGNCIFNTTTAINIVSGLNVDQNRYMNMPVFRHNYLYNYREVGLRAENITGILTGHNSFIGNNNADDIRQIITGGIGAILLSNNDDFGTEVAQVSGGVNVRSPENPAPSGSSCGNQDLGNLDADILLRCNDDVSLDTGTGIGILTQVSVGVTTLVSSFETVFDDVYKVDSEDAFEVTMSGVQVLEDDQEASRLYQVAMTKSWEANQDAWLTYQYKIRQQDLTGAGQALTSIQSTDQNEMDQVMIANILLNQQESLDGLSDEDVSVLQGIIDGGGLQASIARNLLHITKGGNPYIYPSVVITQQEDDVISKIVDVSRNSLLLYPNPVENEVSVKIFDGQETWEVAGVYNMFGRLLDQKDVAANQLSFNVGDLAPGVYFIRLSNSNSKQLTKKFIKR